MLYYFFEFLEKNYQIPGASLFTYISFRTAAATILSLLISTIFGKKIIKFLKHKQIGESIRNLGLSGQSKKKGTPTMGGLMILLGIFSGVVLWGDFSNPYNWFLLYITGSFGLLGAYDDYKKIKKNN